jgi:hypothetical protein
MTNRIMRGFRRLGIVISAPFLIAGAVAMGLTERTYQQALVKAPIIHGTPGLFDDITIDYNKNYSDGMGIALVVVGIGVSIFLFCISVGWIISGFSRDQGPPRPPL